MTDPGWPRRWVARAGLVAVAAAAFRSSYDALVVVGTRAHMGDPRMLPLCLDGLAISTAAAIEGGRRRDWWPWLVLVAADAISTSLQVAAAPDDWSSRVVAAIPTPAALAAFHVIVWAAEVAASESASAEGATRRPPAPAEVEGALSRGRTINRRPREAPPVPVVTPEPIVSPATDDLLAQARAAKVAMPNIGRARLADQLGVSDRKARDLLAALAEEQAA